MRTLIKNGTVVNRDSSEKADVLISNGTIQGVGGGGYDAEREVDATDKYVIPGGIDVHTHLEMPFAGTVTKDNFESGTRAAAIGGTTTIIDFAIQKRGGSLRESVDAWHAKADGSAAVDYGFHVIVSDVNDETLGEMDDLVNEGITSFKLFTAYPGVFFSDDAAVFRALQRSKANGSMIMIHAENGPTIDVIAAQTVESGMTEPYFHGTSRPAALEAEATSRVLRLAEVASAPVYFVHLSAAEALNELRRARDRNQTVYAETCPHYLFLTLESLGNGWEGAKYVCSPPLRTRDDIDALWAGLGARDLQVVSSDHCAFDFEGQKELGRADFRKIPNGVPDIEHRLDLLHSGGVLSDLLSVQDWVDLTSATPARLFGLTNKGRIAPGADADVVIYDPTVKRRISASTHHMAVDYNLYEGLEVQGMAEMVFNRGRLIVEGGEYVGQAGDGRFVQREPRGD